jgi:hypothetical protein
MLSESIRETSKYTRLFIIIHLLGFSIRMNLYADQDSSLRYTFGIKREVEPSVVLGSDGDDRDEGVQRLLRMMP